MQTTGVCRFLRGFTDIVHSSDKMRFFLLGAGGSFYGQLGMGAQHTVIVLGIKERAIFERSTDAASGSHHGKSCDVRGLCQGTVL